jgi:hypothetical protein
VSAPATGASALLDAWTVTKPEVGNSVVATLSAPGEIARGQAITYAVSIRNDSESTALPLETNAVSTNVR